MIDIIIPCYNSHNTIRDTLDSIKNQENVSLVNVYLIDDCSDKDYSEEIKLYNSYFPIKQIRLDNNSGPGIARRVGLKESNSEFVTFIDSDDCLYANDSLKILYDSITNGDYDLVISRTIEETPKGMIERDTNTIWLHGKLYRRSFLDKYDITFNDSRSNEDNGFNQLICLLKAKIKYVFKITYIWKYNNNSITRSNNYSYDYLSIIGYAYNIYWALDNALKYDYDKNKFSNLAYTSLVSLYYYYISYYDKLSVDELFDYAIKIGKYYNMNPVSEDRKIQIFDFQSKMFKKNNKYKQLIINPCITFDEFLDKIGVK